MPDATGTNSEDWRNETVSKGELYDALNEVAENFNRASYSFPRKSIPGDVFRLFKSGFESAANYVKKGSL